jgi:hypothetical protein
MRPTESWFPMAKLSFAMSAFPSPKLRNERENLVMEE